MVTFEQQIPVQLAFRAMSMPVTINVPNYVLRYLDTHADRAFSDDGFVVYRQPAGDNLLPELRLKQETAAIAY